MKKLICVLVTLCLLIGIVPMSAMAGEAKDVIEINLSLTFPEVSAGGVLKWEDEIVAATDGRVKFNNYYSYSLVALPDLIKGLQTGIVDMASMVPYEYPSLFTLNGNVMGLPFLGWKSEADACEIYWEMLEEKPALIEEYEAYNLHYYGSYFMPGYNMFMTTTEPMETPADLKGHKTITGAATIQQLLANNSAAPISSGPTDYYSNMEKGVADSIISHINVLGAFGVCPELINKAVFFGDKYAGAYMYVNATVFAQAFWEKLPEDIQAVFNEYAPHLGQYMLESDMGLTEKFIGDLEAKGAEIVVLNSDQVQVWADDLALLTEADLASWSKENENTMDIYNTVLEKINK